MHFEVLQRYINRYACFRHSRYVSFFFFYENNIYSSQLKKNNNKTPKVLIEVKLTFGSKFSCSFCLLWQFICVWYLFKRARMRSILYYCILISSFLIFNLLLINITVKGKLIHKVVQHDKWPSFNMRYGICKWSISLVCRSLDWDVYCTCGVNNRSFYRQKIEFCTRNGVHTGRYVISSGKSAMTRLCGSCHSLKAFPHTCAEMDTHASQSMVYYKVLLHFDLAPRSPSPLHIFILMDVSPWKSTAKNARVLYYHNNSRQIGLGL